MQPVSKVVYEIKSTWEFPLKPTQWPTYGCLVAEHFGGRQDMCIDQRLVDSHERL